MKGKKTYATTFMRAYITLLLIVCLFLPFYEKGKFELFINKAHNPLYDVFFAGITQIGDGAILVLPIFLLLFVKFSYAIFVGWSTIVHMVLVNLGKRVLFRGMPRPIEFLSGHDVYTIPGVPISHWHSFPSGHTTTIFMLTSALSMLSYKKKWLQQALLGVAVLVGFSRIYLMQHFLSDVLAGSLLGVISSYLGRWITLKYFSRKKYRKSLYPKRKKIRSHALTP